MQTNTHPIDNVVSTLSQELNQAPPQSLQDPRLDSLIDTQAIAHQLQIAGAFHALSAANPADFAASSRFLRSLILLERTRHRVARANALLEPREPTVQREDAIRFLQGELSSGPRPAREMLEAARKHGISQRTLIRAKNQLNIVSIMVHPEGQPHRWMWSCSSLSQNA